MLGTHSKSILLRRGDGPMNDKAVRSMLLFGALLGLVFLVLALYLFFDRLLFLRKAAFASAPIVAVTHEPIRSGRGTVQAYIPTIQLVDNEGHAHEVKVDTYSRAAIYGVGQQLPVVCDMNPTCIEDTFFAKWGTILVAALVSAILLTPFVVYRLRTGTPG